MCIGRTRSRMGSREISSPRPATTAARCCGGRTSATGENQISATGESPSTCCRISLIRGGSDAHHKSLVRQLAGHRRRRRGFGLALAMPRTGVNALIHSMAAEKCPISVAELGVTLGPGSGCPASWCPVCRPARILLLLPSVGRWPCDMGQEPPSHICQHRRRRERPVWHAEWGGCSRCMRL